MKIKYISALLLLVIVISCKKKSDEIPIGEPELEVSFTQNPAGVNPLCAKLKLESNVIGKVRIDIIGQDGEASNISHTFDELSQSHTIPVLGLYADYDNTVQITYLDEEDKEWLKKEVKITTAALSGFYPTATIEVRQTEKMEPGLTLISNRSTYSPHRPYAIDAFGKIRWLLDYSNHPKLSDLYYDVGLERLQNGNFYFGDGRTDAIYEIDVYGEIINTWILPNYGFHHNVQEKPDGNFLVTVNHYDTWHLNGNQTKEDYILEIDRQSGAVVAEWDLKESLDEYRIAWDNTLNDMVMDWAHANAVIHDESDNTIIVSCRKQGIVKLDYDNNVVWILAPHLGWETNRQGNNLNDFLLTPLDANSNPITDTQVLNGYENHIDFEWNWYQHAPLIMPNGHLLLFDNGENRNYGASPNYSRAVEYRIDKEAKTVQQIWQYGKERGSETYSFIVSDVDYLPHQNNVLFSPGWCRGNIDSGRVVELDYDTKEVVFEAVLTGGALGLQFHRAERLSIYPDR